MLVVCAALDMFCSAIMTGRDVQALDHPNGSNAAAYDEDDENDVVMDDAYC
jgi:hypothetical protein